MNENTSDFDRQMAEFFARGGKIQQVAPNVSGRAEGDTYSAWGAPRKKAGRPAADSPVIEEDLSED